MTKPLLQMVLMWPSKFGSEAGKIQVTNMFTVSLPRATQNKMKRFSDNRRMAKLINCVRGKVFKVFLITLTHALLAKLWS